MAWYDGIADAFSGWDAKDWGTVMQGAGTLAGAWGQYESDKSRNKLIQDQLAYEKQKDALANSKLDKAQASLDDAFSSSLLNPKKKKATDPLSGVEDTTATTAVA